MYTHFFFVILLLLVLSAKLYIFQQNGQRAINQPLCVILFTDKFPKCQTLEDKMMFYEAWWTVQKKNENGMTAKNRHHLARIEQKKKTNNEIKQRKMVFNKYQHVTACSSSSALFRYPLSDLILPFSSFFLYSLACAIKVFLFFFTFSE